MPSWLIIAIAIVVLVVGIGLCALLSIRRRGVDALDAQLASLRARAEGLEFRLDARTAEPSPDGTRHDVAEARRLISSAVATLSSARAHRSRSAAGEAARTLDLAAAQIADIAGQCR